MQNKGTAHCAQKGHQTRGKVMFASSPSRKRRANQLNKMWTHMSGSSAADSVKQQGTERKLTRKQERTEILKAAGCGELHVSSKLATKLTARLSLSWTKQRQLRKVSKSVGIKTDSENKETFSERFDVCKHLCRTKCHVFLLKNQQTA